MLFNQGSPFSHKAGIQRTMGSKAVYFKISYSRRKNDKKTWMWKYVQDYNNKLNVNDYNKILL